MLLMNYLTQNQFNDDIIKVIRYYDHGDLTIQVVKLNCNHCETQLSAQKKINMCRVYKKTINNKQLQTSFTLWKIFKVIITNKKCKKIKI